MAEQRKSTKAAEITSADTVNDEQTAEVASPPPARAATVAQQRYSEGEGWELGQRAPADRWRLLDQSGSLVGKPLTKAPAGKYAVQVAIKGQPVTNSVRAELGLD